jgi:hypothetical protein
MAGYSFSNASRVIPNFAAIWASTPPLIMTNSQPRTVVGTGVGGHGSVGGLSHGGLLGLGLAGGMGLAGGRGLAAGHGVSPGHSSSAATGQLKVHAEASRVGRFTRQVRAASSRVAVAVAAAAEEEVAAAAATAAVLAAAV